MVQITLPLPAGPEGGLLLDKALKQAQNRDHQSASGLRPRQPGATRKERPHSDGIKIPGQPVADRVFVNYLVACRRKQQPVLSPQQYTKTVRFPWLQR